MPRVTAVSGEILFLKCPVAGYPIEEIHWERGDLQNFCCKGKKLILNNISTGGRELPEDIRQKVQPDGSLVISPVQKNDDSGTYTCWARNKQGHSARRSADVNVIGNISLYRLLFNMV